MTQNGSSGKARFLNLGIIDIWGWTNVVGRKGLTWAS
jgi:hypothetical protein